MCQSLSIQQKFGDERGFFCDFFHLNVQLLVVKRGSGFTYILKLSVQSNS